MNAKSKRGYLIVIGTSPKNEEEEEEAEEVRRFQTKSKM